MMKKLGSRFFMGAVMAAMLSFAGMTGCGSNDNDTDNVTLTGDNCDNACARYAICYNASFDTVACVNRCEAAINSATITVTTTDDCLACIGANVCASATYACDAVCGAFIVVTAQ